MASTCLFGRGGGFRSSLLANPRRLARNETGTGYGFSADKKLR
jgi:hypothetical protein